MYYVSKHSTSALKQESCFPYGSKLLPTLLAILIWLVSGARWAAAAEQMAANIGSDIASAEVIQPIIEARKSTDAGAVKEETVRSDSEGRSKSTLVLDPATASADNSQPDLAEQLMAAASQRLDQHAKRQHWLAHQAEFSAWLPAGVEHLPTCQQAVHYQTAQPDARPWGRIPYQLQCKDEKGWTVRARVNVKVRLAVWVAAEPLRREQTISPAQLELKTLDIARLHRGFISSQQPPTQRLLRDLAVGKPLYPALLAPQWLVQQNEQVVIEAIGESFAVSTQGLALGNASKGELVLVENLDSGKRIQARVVAKNKVQSLR